MIIGNGGAEYGVRGYVTAYDAETGEQAWRAYTVPGNPAHGFENEAMPAAAETWTGGWWVVGGGGSAWDAFTYGTIKSRRVWEAEVGGSTATPMTYELDGVQYVSIAGGSTHRRPRMWTFVLDGAAESP